MKDLLKVIWKIVKGIDQVFTIFRNAIFNILLLILLVIVVIALLRPERDQKSAQKIPDNTILKVAVVGSLVEQERYPEPLQKLLGDFGDYREKETSLQDVLDAIQFAAEDSRIKAILLNTEKMTAAGLNQLHSIGDALMNFRRTGKKVIAVADSYRQGEYFLASYADQIFLNPMGRVEINGMGRYSLYFREALDRVLIDYNVFKVGAYKSAIEPITRNSMSEQDKEQSLVWLSALWSRYCSEVTTNRKLEQDALQRYTENIESNLRKVDGDLARLALDQGLVDALYTRQQSENYFYQLTGQPRDEEINVISTAEYLADDSIVRSYSFSEGNIAILVAEGMILDGRHRQGLIGGDNLAALIREVGSDPAVKALVLRINSGGGSAFASEIIRQELLALKRKGKKLVVSMGTIAASGGYWIAASADQIWASPSTLTGSIGVFGALPTFDRSLAAVGVHRDGVATTSLGNGFSPLQPLNPQLRSVIQQTVEHTYTTFLRVVAEGRKIDQASVENLAQGKIYDGVRAKQVGLVDELGDLSQAITAAAKLAGIQDEKAFYYRPEQTFRQQLVKMLGSVRYSLLVFLAGGQFDLLGNAIVSSPHLMLLKNGYDRNHIYSYTPVLLSIE